MPLFLLLPSMATRRIVCPPLGNWSRCAALCTTMTCSFKWSGTSCRPWVGPSDTQLSTAFFRLPSWTPLTSRKLNTWRCISWKSVSSTASSCLSRRLTWPEHRWPSRVASSTDLNLVTRNGLPSTTRWRWWASRSSSTSRLRFWLGSTRRLTTLEFRGSWSSSWPVKPPLPATRHHPLRRKFLRNPSLTMVRLDWPLHRRATMFRTWPMVTWLRPSLRKTMRSSILVTRTSSRESLVRLFAPPRLLRPVLCNTWPLIPTKRRPRISNNSTHSLRLHFLQPTEPKNILWWNGAGPVEVEDPCPISWTDWGWSRPPYAAIILWWHLLPVCHLCDIYSTWTYLSIIGTYSFPSWSRLIISRISTISLFSLSVLKLHTHLILVFFQFIPRSMFFVIIFFIPSIASASRSSFLNCISLSSFFQHPFWVLQIHSSQTPPVGDMCFGIPLMGFFILFAPVLPTFLCSPPFLPPLSFSENMLIWFHLSLPSPLCAITQTPNLSLLVSCNIHIWVFPGVERSHQKDTKKRLKKRRQKRAPKKKKKKSRKKKINKTNQSPFNDPVERDWLFIYSCLYPRLYVR